VTGMAEASELYGWLDKLGSQGNKDSEGHFTLRVDKAWSKLTAFQFPIEEGWVLKVVQAMSTCPGATLRVSQLASETLFLIRGTSDWTRERVEEALFGFDLQGRSPINHISTAIRILVQLKNRPFAVRYDDGEKVVWTGEGFVQSSLREASVFAIRVGHYTFDEQRIGRTGASSARVSVKIAAALRYHCHLAPEPIYVDGFRISAGENDLNMGSPNSGHPLALLQVADDCELPTFKLATPSGVPKVNLGRQIAYLDTNLAPELKENKVCRAAALLSVFAQNGKLQKKPSTILWLKDGVVVHRERMLLVSRAVGIGIVISSVGLETDISGLKPRKTESYFQRRRLGVRVVHRQLRDTLQKLGSEGVSTRASGTLSSILSGAGLLFFAKVPVIGLWILGFAGVSYLSNLGSIFSIDSRLDGDLEALVRELGELIQREKV
jgi:hypothetical protein